MPRAPLPAPRSKSHAAETVVTLFATAARVRRAFASAIEFHGVTLQQLNVLRILRGAGAEGLPTMAVADRMIERDPGITRLLDRLHRKKLVRRKRMTNDRRRIVVAITESGRALLDGLDRPIAGLDQAIVSDLSPDEEKMLVRLLGRLRSDPPR